MMARSDGASAGFGFSTMSVTSCTPSEMWLVPTQPYAEMFSSGTRSRARTVPRYFRWTSRSCPRHGFSPSMMSSPRSTDGEKPCLGQLLEVHRKYRGTVLALERVPLENISSYGCVGANHISDGVHEVTDM